MNERFGHTSPPVEVAPGDATLWALFCECAGDEAINAAKLANWRGMTGGLLCRDQILALSKIDRAYRAAVAQERADQRSRENG